MSEQQFYVAIDMCESAHDVIALCQAYMAQPIHVPFAGEQS